MKYRLAVFDLDGTILDTLEDLAVSTNEALRANGLPERSTTEVRQFVGNGIRKLMERAVPAGTEPSVIDAVHAAFTEHYRVHCADHTRPYEGIEELLKAIRYEGMLTAVVSNKADYGVQSLCRDYFPGLFDFAVGEREGIRRKPNPDSVLAVMKKFGVDAADAVYIGDSDVDITTARNAGLPAVIVTWGFRDEPFLRAQGAERLAHTTKELLQWLE